MHPLAAAMQDECDVGDSDGTAGAGVAPSGERTIDRAAALARLRREVRSIERGGVGARRAMPFGMPAIDAALGSEGLPLACLHAFEGTAADGFAAAVAGRLIDGPGVGLAGGALPGVVWCVPAGARARLYPPGLAGLGLDPGRLIVVLCHRRAEMLAVMEDALRSGAPALVVAELASDPEARTSRRLQLACEAGGVTGVLLLTDERREGAAAGASVAAFHSRWRIEPTPTKRVMAAEGAGGEQRPGETTIATRWRLSLVRNRGGAGGSWDVDWDDATHRFALAAEAGHR